MNRCDLFTKKIFKYEIPIADKFNLELRVGSELLSFQVQNRKPMLWVLIDENKPTQKYFFSLYGTGQPTDIDFSCNSYVGTIQLGEFVWHLFHDFIVRDK